MAKHQQLGSNSRENMHMPIVMHIICIIALLPAKLCIGVSPFRGFGYRAAFCRTITINYHTLCDISGPLSRVFFIRRSGLMFGKVARRFRGGPDSPRRFRDGYPAIPSKWPGSGLQVNRGQNFILSFMTAAVTREFSCSHARKSGGNRTLRGRFALGRADFILGHLNKRH